MIRKTTYAYETIDYIIFEQNGSQLDESKELYETEEATRKEAINHINRLENGEQ